MAIERTSQNSDECASHFFQTRKTFFKIGCKFARFFHAPRTEVYVHDSYMSGAGAWGKDGENVIVRTMTTAIATLGIIATALLAGGSMAPQAEAATASSRHHARTTVRTYRHMPRYYNQAPIDEPAGPEAPTAAQRYYTDPPGWHDPSGCGIRCF
jgi:hypothetical protein